jgi:hypothetical protein
MNLAGSGFLATAFSADFLASAISSLAASASSFASCFESSGDLGAFPFATGVSLSFLIISSALSLAAFS